MRPLSCRKQAAGILGCVSAPVTVSITRHVDPSHTDEMLAWVRAGTALAARFDGFLGTGWVRPGGGSDAWHMLYRFEDDDSLARWEASPQRRWWLGAAQGLVGESQMERRTGIEGWFDPPTGYDVADLRPQPKAPPVWTQAVVIWLGFFPLNLLVTWLATLLVPELNLALRVLASTLVLTPIMTYVVLPRITAALEWWLQGKAAPWRR